MFKKIKKKLFLTNINKTKLLISIYFAISLYLMMQFLAHDGWCGDLEEIPPFLHSLRDIPSH